MPSESTSNARVYDNHIRCHCYFLSCFNSDADILLQLDVPNMTWIEVGRLENGESASI